MTTISIEDDLQEIRKANLKAIVEIYSNGSVETLAETLQKHRTYVYAMLKDMTLNNPRKITNTMSRFIESKYSLPPLSLDEPNYVKALHSFKDNSQTVRKRNLNNIFESYFSSITAFGEKLKMNRSNLSTLLSGDRPITDATAKKIELLLALPKGYLSNDKNHPININTNLSIKYFRDLDDFQESQAQEIQMPLIFIEQLNFKDEDNANIIVSHMSDNKMAPTLFLGQILFIDSNDTKIEDNNLYLIEINGVNKVRRLVMNNDFVNVHIDNQQNINTHVVTSFKLNEIIIKGKLIGCFTNDF